MDTIFYNGKIYTEDMQCSGGEKRRYRGIGSG